MAEEAEALVFRLLPSVDNLVFLLEVCAELKVEALEDGGLSVF